MVVNTVNLAFRFTRVRVCGVLWTYCTTCTKYEVVSLRSIRTVLSQKRNTCKDTSTFCTVRPLETFLRTDRWYSTDIFYAVLYCTGRDMNQKTLTRLLSVVTWPLRSTQLFPVSQIATPFRQQTTPPLARSSPTSPYDHPFWSRHSSSQGRGE